MKIRPVDENGDILPVLQIANMVSGPAAVSRLAECRLNLLSGDWWENPEHGNEILRMLQESRMTEADAQALSGYLSSYVKETSGVLDVRDVKWNLDGTRFSWSCKVMTEEGETVAEYHVD